MLIQRLDQLLFLFVVRAQKLSKLLKHNQPQKRILRETNQSSRNINRLKRIIFGWNSSTFTHPHRFFLQGVQELLPGHSRLVAHFLRAGLVVLLSAGRAVMCEVVLVVARLVVPAVLSVVLVAVPVDPVERGAAVETKLQAAVLVLTGHVITVFILQERGFALRTVPDLFVVLVDGCHDFLEITSGRVALLCVLETLAELANTDVAMFTYKGFFVALEAASDAAARTHDVQFEDNSVGQFCEVLEVHQLLQLGLAIQGPTTILVWAAEVLEQSATFLNFSLQVFAVAVSANAVAALLEAIEVFLLVVADFAEPLLGFSSLFSGHFFESLGLALGFVELEHVKIVDKFLHGIVWVQWCWMLVVSCRGQVELEFW